ncbi:MAG: A/G-specific adenine glycosylase [Thermoplasmata archaeon]|nr:A/G-specific adenine glycosylase [Thermoplasmata archaeon]
MSKKSGERARVPGSRPGARGRRLVRWFHRVERPLPWRTRGDAYSTWVAEVILQQTRVAQAAPYFERFIARFPTVEALASASEEEVLKVWEGAGYYARARNIRRAAQELVDRFGGSLPSSVPELESLPGVGPYIARAVASIAFGVPVLALEANGLRVAARLTGENGNLRTPAVRRRLTAALDHDRPPSESGRYNEALMELGETVCLPRRPNCPACPISAGCRAYESGDPSSIPAHTRRSRRPEVKAAVAAIRWDGRWLVQRRPSGGLLGGLWEFPGGKIRRGENSVDAARREMREELGWSLKSLRPLGVVHHAYSHFTTRLFVFEGVLGRGRAAGSWHGTPRRWVTLEELNRLPIPRATAKILPFLAPRSLGRASPGSSRRPGRTPP